MSVLELEKYDVKSYISREDIFTDNGAELFCDIYIRVSTSKESQQDSVKNQLDICKLVAKELGYTIRNICLDDGKTGTNVNGRKQYQLMIDDIKNKRISMIITKDVERLNRNLLEFCKFIDLALRNDVKIYFYLDKKEFEFTDSIIIMIRAVLAEEYSKNLSRKAKDSHRYRQENGKNVILTNQTWGYKNISLEDGTKVVVIDEPQAEMIRIIFDLCIQGLGVHKIAKRLYKMGYRNSNGNIFSKSVLLQIIKNPKVTGTVIFHKKEYDLGKHKQIKLPEQEWIYKENMVPAIISKETYELANAVLDGRTNRKKEDFKETEIKGYFQGSSMLSGKIVCGECGSTYTRQPRTLTGGDRVYDWHCSRYRNVGRKTTNPYRNKQNCAADVRLGEYGCDGVSLKQEVLYQLLKKITEQYFGTDSRMIDETIVLLRGGIQKARENSVDTKELECLQNSIDRVNGTIQDLTKKLINGVLTDDTYKLMVKDYEKEREDLRIRYFALNEKSAELQDVENRIKKIEDILSNGALEEATITTTMEYIDKIYVYFDRFEVTFCVEKLLGLDNKVLLDSLEVSNKLIYPVEPCQMKYKRQAMDKTNEIIYNAIKNNSKISNTELAELSGLSRTTIHFRLTRFKELGYIRHCLEKGKRSEWEVLREWNSDDDTRLTMRKDSMVS